METRYQTCQDESHECWTALCLWAGSPQCGGCDLDGCPSTACDNVREDAWMRAVERVML